MKLDRPHAAAAADNICLVIPYFEAGPALLESLNTVQLSANDAIVVVDDGSEIAPAESVCPKKVGPTPVSLITLPRNLGIVGALRAGIGAAPADCALIARLDCGDTCHPRRFERQRAYLTSHPACGIVGSWVDFVTPSGKYLYTKRFPRDAAEIRNHMRINAALCHPAVIFRRSLYEALGGYSHDFPAAEDYALFREMASRTEASNIEESLTTCLTSDGGISERNRKRQLKTRIRVIIRNWDWHPVSFYGLARAVGQLATTRRFSSLIQKTFTSINPSSRTSDD